MERQYGRPMDEYMAYSDDADVGDRICIINTHTGRTEKLKCKHGKVMLLRNGS